MKQKSDTKKTYLQTVERELKEKDYAHAEEKIKLALLENPHSPIVQNLYGALEELRGNNDLALRHYRAAYALDPAYEPASRNLERMVQMDYGKDGKSIDYGDEPEQTKESAYGIRYDERRVGHLYQKDLG